MTCWNKEELESMLEDVVSECWPHMTEGMGDKFGQDGTAPSEIVKAVLELKDFQIKALKAGFIHLS